MSNSNNYDILIWKYPQSHYLCWFWLVAAVYALTQAWWNFYPSKQSPRLGLVQSCCFLMKCKIFMMFQIGPCFTTKVFFQWCSSFNEFHCRRRWCFANTFFDICYVEKLSQETKVFNEKPHVTARNQTPEALVHSGMWWFVSANPVTDL